MKEKQKELNLGTESQIGTSPYKNGDPPYARDSETSRQAALKVKQKLGRLQADYLLALEVAKARGLTDHEAAEQLNKPLSSICARRNELMKFTPPLVSETPRSRRTIYGGMATVWISATTKKEAR